MAGLREWLRETYKLSFGHQEVRPRIICNDGFSMSVQAGWGLYCTPRKNLKSGDYTEVEIGFPNKKEELICGYAENSSDYTETVYPYVPVEVVEAVIEKHGGLLKSEVKEEA